MTLWQQYFGTLKFFWTPSPLSQWHHFVCSSPLLAFMITIFVKWTFITIAFLYGHLKDKIYFEQLESCISPHDEFKVCCLLKSLYGLKQALHVWYAHFNAHFLNIRYIRCSSNTNFYIKCTYIFFYYHRDICWRSCYCFKWFTILEGF